MYNDACLINQGPFLIVMKCQEGFIFGGYMAADVPRNCDNIPDPSNSSFLFSLKNPKGEIVQKYSINPEKNHFAFFCFK
jgi:hypothetical protein